MKIKQLVALMLVLLLGAQSFAGEPPAAPAAPATPAVPAKPVVDPKADEVIKKVVEYYKGVKTAETTVETTMKMENGAQKQEMNSTCELAIERPNKLLAKVTEKMSGGGTVVSDGTKLYMHLPMMKKYAEQDAPKTMDEILDSPVAMVAQFANIVLVLFSNDPYVKIMDDVTKVTYVGQDDIDGKKHDHIKFIQSTIDLDVWFEASEKPIVRRIKPDLSRQFAQNGQQFQNMKMDGTVEVKNWKDNQPIAADKFTFAVPAGAEKVDSVQKIFARGPAGAEGEDPAGALKGKPAPEFSIDLLGGGKASLAEHKGKNVVILDFWATWCGPCVRGLPIVTEIAKQYADKGVVFYAMNEGEDAPTIEPFLKEKKLELKVGLDKDSSVGKAYGVTGIPHTVIIDKEGVIRVVHVGFSPGLKGELTKELDEILAGKTAAPAAKTEVK